MISKILKALSFLLICIQLSVSQYADDSVRESSHYKQAFDPVINSKYDLNAYFVVMNFVEKQAQTNVNNRLSNEKNEEITAQTMLRYSRGTDENINELTNQARVALRVGNAIATELQNNPDEVTKTLRALQAPSSQCIFPKVSPCLATEIYRRIDGTCTNLNVPHWGKANLPFKRFLPPFYENNFDSVQTKGKTGLLLPNPRSLSLQLFNDNLEFDLSRTSINAAFGQFIDHDFTSIAESSKKCGCFDTNAECLTIPTPTEDIANRNDQKCMIQVRSSPSFTNVECGFGHREQMNILSAVIDLSHIYGNDDATKKLLREFSGGRLRTVRKGVNGRELLPPFGSSICRDEAGDKNCFLTADGARANINMHLASMHTLWVREHNRIARSLQSFNPFWSDEKLFEETRRINIAQTQAIIYNEWLPNIIGWDAALKYDLLPSGNKYYSGYNQNVDVGVYNEFTTNAFRLHTLVRTSFSQMHPSYPTKILTLQDVTFRAVAAHEGSGVDGLLIGSIVDTISKFDSAFTTGLQNKLFEVPGNQNATVKRFDLAALNINRCREHGCAPYVEYREWCGLTKPKRFSDLVEIDALNQAKLTTMYQDVNNIELFVGGSLEKPLSGSLVGPTFACLIARQFRDFKRGDRFWYENPSQINPNPFSLTQLSQLQKITLATIFCENVDGVSTIQPNAFLSSAVPLNGKVFCSQIAKLDLRLF